MKTIPLTQGQITIVDDQDFLRFGHLKWCAARCKKTKGFYATGHSSTINGKRRTIRLHRQIMGVTDPKVKVDHKNHDTLDNRRHNLRICTNLQNCANKRGLACNNTSGNRGVSWNKISSNWRAQIRVNGKLISLGSFNKKSDAAAAYAAANRQHFGEFGGKI